MTESVLERTMSDGDIATTTSVYKLRVHLCTQAAVTVSPVSSLSSSIINSSSWVARHRYLGDSR